MHYNLGWANGFHYNIRYWEFWNELEALFWSGTPQQFYSLYEKTARGLKSVDPTLKVGNDANAIALDDERYREGLIGYCASAAPAPSPSGSYASRSHSANFRLVVAVLGVLPSRREYRPKSSLTDTRSDTLKRSNSTLQKCRNVMGSGSLHLISSGVSWIRSAREAPDDSKLRVCERCGKGSSSTLGALSQRAARFRDW